jgi:hypothetical protein
LGVRQAPQQAWRLLPAAQQQQAAAAARRLVAPVTAVPPPLQWQQPAGRALAPPAASMARARSQLQAQHHQRPQRAQLRGKCRQCATHPGLLLSSRAWRRVLLLQLLLAPTLQPEHSLLRMTWLLVLVLVLAGWRARRQPTVTSLQAQRWQRLLTAQLPTPPLSSSRRTQLTTLPQQQQQQQHQTLPQQPPAQAARRVRSTGTRTRPAGGAWC